MVNKDSNILLTGASGFLGGYVSDWLIAAGYENVYTAEGSTKGLDLRDEATIGWLLDWAKPDCVIHLASRNSGLQNNARYPAGIMYENLTMSLKLLEESRQSGVKKFIMAGDMCCYSDQVPSPFRETDLWMGRSHISKRFYGHTKRILMDFNTALSNQFDWCGINLIFSDIYGIGDKWNPLYGKIIPSAISNIMAAKDEDRELNIFGSPKAERDFINVADAANAILLCVEKQNEPNIYNVGSGKSTNIGDLHEMIAKASGYEKEIIWNEEEIKGPPKRALNIQRIKNDLGWEPIVNLETGLTSLVKWHNEHLKIGYVPEDTLSLSHPS